jgi:NYN domain
MDLASVLHTEPRHRVAVLIDGDNYPRADVGKVEAAANHWGEVTIRRVFGDMALHKDWAQDLTYTSSHSPTTGGKNRADMLLVVTAMDLAHRGLATAFVIVSDDRDFAPLINHLREQVYRVEWLGKVVRPPKTTETAKPKAATRAEPFIDKVKRMVGKDGCPIQSLGPAGQKLGIKISNTPQKTWRAWLLAHDSEFVCDPRGPEARVRLKR